MKKLSNWLGVKHKILVEAITEWMSAFQKEPALAYVTHNCAFDERTELEDENAMPVASAEPLEAIAKDGTSNTLSVEMPLEGFNDTALSNLEKLVASKAPLIKKAIGADELPIVRQDDRLCFPWFRADSSADEVDAYTRLIHALCEMAKTQKRVTAKEQAVESEKYAFRCFLLRLGFIGSDFASARKILLANLSGSGSSKSDKRKESTDSTSREDDLLAEALADAELIHRIHMPFEEDEEDDLLAEALADAELIHNVNMAFEREGLGHGE